MALKLTSPAGTALVIGALTALRVLHLYHCPFDLYPDEAQYWVWAQDFAFGYFSKPPMVGWIIAATTAMCGDGVACIKLGMPVVHFVTAMAVYGIGRRLFDARTAMFSALVFATVPGIFLSSTVVSTDPPLLMFWALALYGLVRATQDGGWRWWLFGGVGLGLGLMSKYAMVYFVISGAVYILLAPFRAPLSPPGRALGAMAALVLAAAIYVPNLAWNAANGFVSYSHTKANASLGGALYHPDNLLEFLGSQFAVFGPILFAVLLIVAVRPWDWARNPPMALLASFALPTLVIVLVLSFISRANANWAAPAYIAATVMVVQWLLARGLAKLIIASLALHILAAGAVFAFAGWQDGRAMVMPAPYDGFARVRGWTRLGAEISAISARYPDAVILTDDRKLMAALLYYVSPRPWAAVKWDPNGRVDDHFDLTRPLRETAASRQGDDRRAFLLVSPRQNPEGVLSRFATSQFIASIRVPIAAGRERVTHVFHLKDFMGYKAARRP